MAGIQLTGLSSGLDWKSVVDQLMELEQLPVTRLQTDKGTLSRESTALTTLGTKLETLKASVTSLKSSSLFAQRTTTVGNTLWAASAESGATVGSHVIAVSRLATASSLRGAADIAQPIRADGDASQVLISAMNLGQPVTAGEFTVNGARVSIAITDTLEEVFQKIGAATGGAVTASYDGTADAVTLNSASPIILGSANDTSNFLKALKLSNNATGTVTSSTRLGAARLDGALDQAGLSTALTGQNPDGTGELRINGVSIAYDTDTDSLRTLISRINASSAGVQASYDSSQDRMILTNKVTGSLGTGIQDVTGNLGASLGLTTGTVVSGVDAEFTIDGGGTLTSSSNTIDESVHGLTSFSVTLGSETTERVTVGSDTGATRTAIEDMIAKYNDVQTYIDEQTKRTTSGTKVVNGLLAGDREVTELARNLRNEVFKAMTGATGGITRLDSLGIDFESFSGKLVVKDATKLDKALRDESGGVKNFFTTSSTGFSGRLDALVTGLLGTDGSITRSVATKAKRSTGIDLQIVDIQRRLKEKRTQLEASFINMEVFQSRAQSQLQTLSNAFGSNSSSK